MPLKTKVQSLDGIPEKDHEHYEERDGMFWLSAETVDGYGLEDIRGLKNALGGERTMVGELKDRLKAFEDIDPAAARDALKKVKDIAAWTPDEKVKEQIEARERVLKEQYDKELGSVRGKLDSRTGQLSKELIENRALMALSKHDMPPRVFMPIMRERLRLIEGDNDEYAVEVVDEAGKTQYSVTNQDDPMAKMQIDELVTSLKDDPEYSAYAPGSGSSGGGATASEGTGGPRMNTDAFNNLPPVERLKAFRRAQAGA